MSREICYCGTDERVSNRRRGTRPPSKYNLFMKECLVGKRGESRPHREKFRDCVSEWKSR